MSVAAEADQSTQWTLNIQRARLQQSIKRKSITAAVATARKNAAARTEKDAIATGSAVPGIVVTTGTTSLLNLRKVGEKSITRALASRADMCRFTHECHRLKIRPVQLMFSDSLFGMILRLYINNICLFLFYFLSISLFLYIFQKLSSIHFFGYHVIVISFLFEFILCK